jgi:ParB family chromosome partitioning protein
MSSDKYYPYRGDLKAGLGLGGTVVFVTLHPENRPTAVYRLDANKLSLDADTLPAGGVALAADIDTIWIAGSDNRIYQMSAKGGTPAPRGSVLASPPIALALLANDRLGVLAGAAILILARKDGKVLQTLELPDPGTCLAADPTGQWLVVGTAKGTVAVFEGEDKDEFLPSASAKLHEGAVTALLFETEDLRFFSAGADQKLLTTHARGQLEPEDKGRGFTHTEVVTALVWGPGDRFFSGSRDSTIKTWPRAGAMRPSTLKDGVGKVVALASLKIRSKNLLAVACDDNTLRIFAIDEEGKFGEASHVIHGALDWARREFEEDDVLRRQAALQALADSGDTASINLLSERIALDLDHGVRLLATELLGASRHPRAAPLLEQWLNHTEEAVRVAALQGLRRHLGEQDLRPLDLALKVEKSDVGKLAVQALQTLAARDDQALARLMAALDAQTLEVRQAALAALEKVYDPQSPDGNLVALNSKHADLRRLTLIRLLQRRLLQHGKVQAALRWRAEDKDAEVRRTAFLLSLCARDKLVHALRARDPELDRQLLELEHFGKEAPSEPKAAKPAAVKARLEDADFDPLLQAAASRALDTCLRGARGLAVLGDPRAFGMLLQLSREEDASARAWVCRALAALDDPRSIQRLRSLLYDADAAVRDAAFSALAHLHQNDPLLAADAGLSAAFEDVRRRGLQALIAAIRKSPPKNVNEPGWQLLIRALNDSFVSVRSEAFKAALNLQLAGGGVHTLRFVLQSSHADIRREVLTEMMAQANESWAWNLLLEFYNDHDPILRQEAFTFASKKTKELPPLQAGLVSQYADVRKLAVDALIKKHSPEAQALLVKALADLDKEVRQMALTSLVGADAQAALVEALKSPHADVRVRAGQAMARHGAKAALAPLLALATAAEPQERERQGDWAALVEAALDGLAELGDATALAPVVPLLDSKHAAIRQKAARALMWISPPQYLESLRQILQHADPQVKYHAALGLAFAGDPMVAALVFAAPAAQVLSPADRLVAALTLGPAGEDQLAGFLDDNDEALRNQALVLLMLQELKAAGKKEDKTPKTGFLSSFLPAAMKAGAATPSRCLACLSSRMPRVRLTAARGLECYADPAAFLEFVVQLFNDRGDDQAWKIPAATIETLADLVVDGSPKTKARTAGLLRHLSAREPAAFNQAWGMHADRFAGEIAALRQRVSGRPPPLSYTPEQLRELAFGAYVGLVREQGGAHARQEFPVMGTQIIRVRQTALSRIFTLARDNAHFARAAQPVFVQALGDPNQDVRMQAFEQLQALGMDSAALGAEALETGHTDLGVRGLQVLTGQASAAGGQQVLEQVMLSRNDDLALEAAKLLIGQRGVLPVAGKALEAVHEPLRQQAVAWLSDEYDKDATAKERLREALRSRYYKVRSAAAFTLAARKDSAAFDALVTFLTAAQEPKRQSRVIKALETLGDSRTPAALLDRLENDPTGTALADELLAAAGAFRRPEVADRILGLMAKHANRRKAGFEAVLTISGFDQDIDDPEDDQPDHSWEEKQFPRHNAVLVRLMEVCFNLGETRLLSRLIPGARWARGPEVDPVLALMTSHADERLRQAAVEAVGWRVRKRNGPADALLKTLKHKDFVSQFLAAEALARAGRTEGLTVLLASVDFLNDVGLRQRAVQALGELADVRALDPLLKLANEDGHALQEAAVEALGHLSQSPRGDDIFKLLEGFAKGDSRVAENALKGLRWLNTHAGWQLIRRRAVDPRCRFRGTAVELLGYNNDPATRDLLLRLLATEETWEVVDAAQTSARRLWGKDALESDYALLQNPQAADIDGYGDTLKRVYQRGEARRLFEVFPRVPPEVQQTLAANLLNRSPLPLAEAQASLDSNDEGTAQLAAKVLGRAGASAAKSGPAVQAAYRKWLKIWEERRQAMALRNEADERLVQRITPCLQALLWAAGRLGDAPDVLVEAAMARLNDPLYRPIRREAVSALAAAKLTPPVAVALEKIVLADDPECRATAADALGRQGAARVAQLAEPLLADRISFNRLTAKESGAAAGVLRKAAGEVHYQGVALPYLIAQGDIKTLSAVLDNKKFPEATRLGAIEGLAQLAREDAEAKLRQIGQTKGEEEELRKAAWRGVRRSQRARRRLGGTS